MKRILKLAVYGIAISAFVSCQKDEPQEIQPWPEWFETATPVNKDFVDVIYFAGTQIDHEYDADGNEIPNILLTGPQKAKMAEEYRTVYTLMCPDSINFFAPFYHQGTMTAIAGLPTSEEVVIATCYEAAGIFRYYMDNLNNGRQFIIAGFSQGAMMVGGILLSMTDEDYSKMKAAYLIGCGIGDALLKNPHVKPACGEFDKGVTISFNSVENNNDIWKDLYFDTHYCINPVNWKTDGTPATFKYDGMTLSNHIDTSTHVLLVEGFDFVTHPSVLPGVSPKWTEHNLHVHEVKMYAPFLRKNIKDRAYR